MKKLRRAPTETSLPPSPVPPPYPVGEEDARALFKLQHLMQDYKELLKDTAAKRKRLQIARQKVLNLTDEVRFLRRRYKYLTKNASPTPYKSKTHSRKVHNALKHKRGKSLATLSSMPLSQEFGGQFSYPDSSHREKKVALPSTSATLDLNQISLPEEEEADFQVTWDAVPTESSNRYMPEGDVPGADLRLSVSRDVRGGTSRVGKRKVSWQDQVALRV